MPQALGQFDTTSVGAELAQAKTPTGQHHPLCPPAVTAVGGEMEEAVALQFSDLGAGPHLDPQHPHAVG